MGPEPRARQEQTGDAHIVDSDVGQRWCGVLVGSWRLGIPGGQMAILSLLAIVFARVEMVDRLHGRVAVAVAVAVAHTDDTRKQWEGI